MTDLEREQLEELQAAVEPEAIRPETRKLPAYLGLTREEMSWAAIAHVSIILAAIIAAVTANSLSILAVIVPALIWYAYRAKSAYVVEQARQATIFQLACIVGWWVLVVGGGILLALGWTITIVLSFLVVGLLLIPVMIIVSLAYAVAIIGLPIAQAVYGCYAAMEAYNGRPFRYRWVADWIDRYVAHSQS